MKICILFLEDNETEIRSINKAIDACQEDSEIEIIPIITKSLEEARRQLLDKQRHIDVAVLDQKVLDDDDAGRILADLLSEEQVRTPVIINSAFPFTLSNPLVIKIIQRGILRYEEIIDYIIEFTKTGITSVLGRKGILDSSLKQIFEKAILPVRDSLTVDDSWSLEDREKSILRLVINHLMMQIDSDNKPWHYAETILRPIGNQVKHGSMIKDRNTSDIYVVMSPSCDLVIHNGNMKTDYISIAYIELHKKLSKRIESLRKKGDSAQINLARTNNCALYYHFLPPLNDIFEGGLINFRKIRSIKVRELNQNFEAPFAQISPQLMKDIQSRFASYFGRQGQPVLFHRD